MNAIQSPLSLRFRADNKGTIKSDANFLRFSVQHTLEQLNINTFTRVDINPEGGFVIVTQNQGDMDATLETLKTKHPKLFIPTKNPTVFMLNNRLKVTVRVDTPSA
jgi:predicted peptidase